MCFLTITNATITNVTITNLKEISHPKKLAVMENKDLPPSTERKLVSKLWCFLHINTYGVT